MLFFMRIEFENIFIQNSDEVELETTIWEQSRRSFIRNVLLGSVIIATPWIASCEINSKKVFEGKGVFTDDELELIHNLQNVLFPNDGNGPSAADVNAHNYLVWYLSDELLKKKDFDFIVNGFQSFKKFAQKELGSSVHLLDLKNDDWQIIITKSCEIYEHKDWLSRILTLIFEALLLDPIYGCNTNELGWEWINHIPGNPRPSDVLKYPNYLSIIYQSNEI
jgi:gluconate 2-dehydrogenase gamma chain